MEPVRQLLVPLLLGGLGLVLLTVSGAVLGGTLELDLGPGDDEGSRTEVLAAPWLEDADAVAASEPGRGYAVAIDEFDGSLTIAWELTSDRADPLVAAAGSGVAARHLRDFARDLGEVTFAGSSDDRVLTLSPPTVATGGDDDVAVVRLRATRPIADDEVRLVVAPPRCGGDGCRSEVVVATSGLEVVGVRNPVAAADGEADPLTVADRDEHRLALELGDGPVEVVLRAAESGIELRDTRTLDLLGSWWEQVRTTVRHLAVLVPWLLLLVVLLRRPAAGELPSRQTMRHGIGLALAGYLLSLYVTTGIDAPRLVRSASETLGVPELPDELWSTSSAATFVVVLGVVFAGAVLVALARTPALLAAVRITLLVLFGVGSLTSTLAASDLAPSVTDHGPWVLGLVTAGFGSGFLGALLLSRALVQRSAGLVDQILIAAAATATAGTLASLRAGVAVNALVGGLTTLVLNGLFIAALFTIPLSVVLVQRVRAVGHEVVSTRLLLGVWVLLLGACVWLVLPREQGVGALAPLTASDVYPVAGATLGAARAALFVTLLAGLWAMARDGGPTEDATSVPLAFAVGAVTLLRPDALLGIVPVSFLVGLPLLWWAVREPRTWRRATDAEVRALARAGHHHRTVKELRGTLHDKVVAGDLGLQEAEQHAEVAFTQARQASAAGVIDVDPVVRARAFGLGAADPWARALFGAVVAIAATLPAFLVSLTELTSPDHVAGAVPVLSALGAIASVLRYPLYGFFFGYFFPWIRGDTGFRKGWSLLAVLAVSESVFLLVPYQRDEEVLSAFVSWNLQLLLLAVALGIAFDYWTLRRARLGFDELIDVHHTSRVVAVSSAVVASAATALAAALAQSAVSLVTTQLPGG